MVNYNPRIWIHLWPNILPDHLFPLVKHPLPMAPTFRKLKLIFKHWLYC